MDLGSRSLVSRACAGMACPQAGFAHTQAGFAHTQAGFAHRPKHMRVKFLSGNPNPPKISVL